MLRPKDTLTSSVLPLIVFPTLIALGAKFMFADHLAAGLSIHIDALCTHAKPGPSAEKAYRIKYTGLRMIDDSVPGPCALVAFFHLLLDAPAAAAAPRTFMAYLLGTALPCVLAVLVEPYRGPRRRHVFPLAWLMLAQGITIALALPAYFLFLSLSHSSGTGTAGGRVIIPAADVTALIWGIVLGSGLPSAALVLLNSARATWAWQFYPIYIALVRGAYNYICASPTSSSAASEPPLATPTYFKEKELDDSLALTKKSHRCLSTLYTLAFALTVGTHAYTTWPLLFSGRLSELRELVLPQVLTTTTFSTSTTTTLSPSPSALAHNFLKWDNALGMSSVMLALLLRTARHWLQGLGMLLWYTISLPLLGAGGAIMGVLMWRDL